MSTSDTLTADDSIKTWLAHPAGGQILRDLLAQSGQDADVLRPVQRLALKRLIKLSKGRFSQELVGELVARAAAGDVPATAPAGRADAAGDTGSAGAGAAASDADLADLDAVERPEWTERLDRGRFAGKTVIVTGPDRGSAAPRHRGSPGRAGA